MIVNVLTLCVVFYILYFALELLKFKEWFSFLYVENGKRLLHRLMSLDSTKFMLFEPSKQYEFKYYQRLILVLITYARKQGVGVNDPLIILKKGLLRDTAFIEKLRGLFLAGIFQHIIISLFSHGLYIYGSHQFETTTSSSVILPLLVFWQFIGLALYCFAFKFSYANSFNHWGYFVESSFKLKILIKSSVPLRLITEEIQLDQLRGSDLKDYFSTFQCFLMQIKDCGRVKMADVDLFIEDLWFFGNYRMDKFYKKVETLKLMLALVVSLPSFLAVFMVFIDGLSP